MSGSAPDATIYWRTLIFKTQLSSELPVCSCTPVCVCVLSLGNPCGWQTDVKISRRPGADLACVCASALQTGVHTRLQSSGTHTPIVFPHLSH